MQTFTGYEPKATGSASSSSAQQIVQADPLAADLSMVSSIEDFLGETIAPTLGNPTSSGNLSSGAKAQAPSATTTSKPALDRLLKLGAPKGAATKPHTAKDD